MRASLVIILASASFVGCAELGDGRRSSKSGSPAEKSEVQARADDATALAAPLATFQPRPVAESGPGTAPSSIQASKPVFEPRPSPIVERFEPIPPAVVASPEPSGSTATPPPALPVLPSEPPIVSSPAVEVVESRTLPTEPTKPAVAIASPLDSPVESRPTPSPSEAYVVGGGQVARRAGQPVAQVGTDVITLPELTAAVKIRIAQLPRGSEPSRREVIALAKGVLRGMVVRTMVLQEAREVMGGPAPVAEAVDQLGRRWDQQELPNQMWREGASNIDDLRAKLASRSSTPESAREEFILRSLAFDLMKRRGSGTDLDGYLADLGRRRTVTSIMTDAELMAAGKRAAAAERVTR